MSRILIAFVALFFTQQLVASHHARIDDGHLFGTMDAIEQSLIDNEHSQAQLRRANRFLQKAIEALEPETGHALLTISETAPYDFGLLPNGGATTHTFTIVNSGNEAATAITEIGLTMPFYFLGGSYPGTSGTCGASLGIGAACTIVVEFSPTVTGAFSDAIHLQYNDGTAIQNVTRQVQGTGTVPALLTISETDPYNFGLHPKNGAPVSHTFTITNTGGYTATSMAELGLSSPFYRVGGTCGATLVPAGSCTVTVDYVPANSSGTDQDSIEIVYNDGSAAQMSSRDVVGSTFEASVAQSK